MVNSDDKPKFGLGVLLGMVIGVVMGIFVAPKSGKENREAVMKKIEELKKILEEEDVQKRVKEIFGVATEEGFKLYKKVQKVVEEKLNELEDTLDDTLDDLDRDKYIKMVKEAVETVKKETKDVDGKIEKLKDYFIEKGNELLRK